MEDFIVRMLNAVGGGGVGVNEGNMLTESPEKFNATLYGLALNISDNAVKPVAAIILAIMFALELQRNSVKFDVSKNLGLKVTAATLVKIGLVMVFAQNSTLLVDAMNSVGTYISTQIVKLSPTAVGNAGTALGDQMRSQVKDAGLMGQVGCLVLLIIPFLLSQLASVVATAVLWVRFVELYTLTAFSSWPFAWVLNDETRPITIGYFKAYMGTVISSVTLLVCLVVYRVLVVQAVRKPAASDQNLAGWIFDNFGSLLLASILLFLVLGVSSKVSRALTGQ